MTSNETLGFYSNEKMLQNIMILRSKFNAKEVVTVESAVKAMGYKESTIIKWAKKGDIPLIHNGKSIVPQTAKNIPNWLIDEL